MEVMDRRRRLRNVEVNDDAIKYGQRLYLSLRHAYFNNEFSQEFQFVMKNQVNAL